MSTYWWIIFCAFIGPFSLSFDKKVNFKQYWKSWLLSFVIVMIPFIICDHLYAKMGVWGFNPRYTGTIYIGKLPLEEILFFVVMPYCCLFVHEVLKAYFPKLKNQKLGQMFGFSIITISGFLGLFFITNWYTGAACLLCFLLCIYYFAIKRVYWWNDFAFTFCVVLIPFLIVNGALTGAITDEPIVWYNPSEIIGSRIVTIPVEDIFYNLCMLLPMYAIHEWRLKKLAKK